MKKVKMRMMRVKTMKQMKRKNKEKKGRQKKRLNSQKCRDDSSESLPLQGHAVAKFIRHKE
jgi:hypothetical protein